MQHQCIVARVYCILARHGELVALTVCKGDGAYMHQFLGEQINAYVQQHCH